MVLFRLVRLKVAVPPLAPHWVRGPAGLATGVGLTVTLRVLALAHSPAPGVKVRVKVPLPAALGLKLLPPLTPGPDQVPLMPLWVVFSAAGASFWQ
jgi:hypothetical protein